MNHFAKIAGLLVCTTIALIPVQSKAQVDTSTTQKLLQYILQPIDKNQIPTGFLEEYGCPISPMATFNGTLTDSNRIDMNLWRTLYFQLQTGWCRTTSNPLPSIISANTTIKQNIGSGLPIPIPLLIGQYNTVNSNAFTSNLLSYNSSTNQVSDVAGRSQSPYDIKNLFAASPNKKQTITGSETFIVKSNLIWNNTTKIISQLQIDFANGQGFKTITVGTPISVSYTDTGYKRWTIKVTLNDNSVLQCYNEYYVIKVNGSARFASGQTVIPAWGPIAAVAGVHSGATIFVNYSRRNNTNTLRKPLIVVEGYDVSFRATNLQENYRSRDLIDAITFEPIGYDFNGQLDDIAGYDLVFVDFNDGADDIIRNAAVVQEVINRVNINKVLDNRFGNIRQQNVVMGLSMGGLCARYALANMTKNFPGTPTEARLLITHDSPHRGANVPLGLQYLLRMVGGAQLFGYNIIDVYPDYNEAIVLLGAAATQQLLLYRSTTANAFVNNTFLDGVYRTMITFPGGGPQPAYRFIATSLGNECARPVYNPYTQLLNVGLDGFIFYFPLVSYRLRTIAETYALPATGSTSKIARFKLSSKFKLFGFITIAKDYYDNTAYAPGTHLAIDGVPGSVTQYASVTAPSFKFLFPIPGVFGFLGYISANTSGTPGNFTFVSTASALDASPYTTPVFSERYVNGVNQNFPSTSQTFIAQETIPNNAAATNNVHIRFTARNSRWMFNEMEGVNPNNENCSGECTPNLILSGADLFCTSSTYQIQNLTAGTVTWSSSPAGIVNIAAIGNGSQATVSKIVNGNVTITATTNCGQAISKLIHVGGYSSSDYPVSGSSSACTNQNVYFSTVVLPGATGYNWFWPSGWSYVSGQNTPNLTVRTGSSPGSGIVGVRVANACDAGGSPGTKFVQVNSCGFAFTASPNPADDEVTIDATTDKTSATQTDVASQQKIYKIELVDQLGNKRKEFEFKQGINKTNLNIAGLPSGLYTIRAFNGTVWAGVQLLKN